MSALPRSRRASRALWALAVLVTAAVLLAGAPAKAQDFNWFGGLLGGGTPQRSPSAPSYPGYDSGGYDDGSRPHHRHAQRRKRPAVDQAQQAGPAKPKAPQKNATLFVGVFGDSLGVMLANGLDEALADRPEVGVLHEARGSTGLVTESFYNWPKTIDELLAKQAKAASEASEKDRAEKEKGGNAAGKDGADKDAKGKLAKDKEKPEKDKPPHIDVAVMMIGINDRQPITQDGKTYQRGTDEWNAIYRKRVMAIAEAFQRRKIPLIWVGIPITKDDNFADDMAALNEIYRDVASKTGATYVDTWEAFGDDNGNFAAFGPDINGQVVRLRSSDGIHFTPQGARKLAHFVEAPVRRDLDGKTPLPQLPTAEAPADGTDVKSSGAGKASADKGKDTKGNEAKGKDAKGKDTKPAVAAVKPEAGPIKNLGEIPAAKDGQLAQAPRPKDLDPADDGSPKETVPANRADNFRWPAGGMPQP